MNIAKKQYHGPRIKTLQVTAKTFKVVLDDGNKISVPMSVFPRLRRADSKQLADWRFIGNGIGIHWEQLDEDISAVSLLSEAQRSVSTVKNASLNQVTVFQEWNDLAKVADRWREKVVPWRVFKERLANHAAI